MTFNTPDICQIYEDLARKLELADDYDLLMVGDGAGSTYDQPGGWSCWAYDRVAGEVTMLAGGMSTATIGLAELIPFVQGLWYHHQRWDGQPQTPVRVQMISDSEVTVRCGNGQYQRRANASFWAAIEWFETNGYEIHWTHIPRYSEHTHELADRLSEVIREVVDSEVSNFLGVPSG